MFVSIEIVKSTSFTIQWDSVWYREKQTKTNKNIFVITEQVEQGAERSLFHFSFGEEKLVCWGFDWDWVTMYCKEFNMDTLIKL